MDSKTIIPSLPLPPSSVLAGFSLDASTASYRHMLLPDEHEIVVNMQTGHYMVVNWDGRYVAVDGRFHELELQLMLALLSAWPSYLPREKVLHALFDRTISDIEELVAIDQAAVSKTVEHVVQSCNAQLALLGLKIQKIEDVGYKLSRLEGKGEHA